MYYCRCPMFSHWVSKNVVSYVILYGNDWCGNDSMGG